MTRSWPRRTAAVVTLLLAGAIACTVGGPASATTAPPGEGPITVIIPGPSPSPSPSGSTGSGGSSNGGGSGSGTDTGTDEQGDPSTGGPITCAATNDDGSPVPAAQPTDDAPELELDRERLPAGEWIIADSEGFIRGERVQIVQYPGAVVIGSYTVDAPTGFSARFRIPAGTPTGFYTLEATGWQSCVVENGEVTVITAPAAPTSLTQWWVYAVVGVLGVGGVSLAIAFRGVLAVWFGLRGASGGI